MLAYANDIALIGKNEIEMRQLFVEMENNARKLVLQINLEKTKYMKKERKKSLKQNKIEHLKIKNYKFERLENFKYLGATLNEDNSCQIDLQERIKNANETYFMLQKFFQKQKHIKETKINTQELNNRQNVNICIRNLDTNKER
jgi:hypothetical protein